MNKKEKIALKSFKAGIKNIKRIADKVYKCKHEFDLDGGQCKYCKKTFSELFDEEQIEKLDKNTITDGFGNYWSIKCPMCGKRSMVVVRPGKVQCENCG